MIKNQITGHFQDQLARKNDKVNGRRYMSISFENTRNSPTKSSRNQREECESDLYENNKILLTF